MKRLPHSRILVTGGAGFIGSHLVANLLQQGHEVVVLDNFLTGKRENVAPFLAHPAFRMVDGDIRDFAMCCEVAAGMDYVLHEAALGSVPRSMENPQRTLEINGQGFVNMIEAARRAKVKRFVFASSSSVYGDDAHVPKLEEFTGKALSPYAVSKQMNEHVAESYGRIFGLETIGLRYFNVFGPRQDPAGAYAAVIPKFILSLIRHEPPVINGDGSYSRDFTYVDNVVQANLLALAAPAEACGAAYNIACGGRTTLRELWNLLYAAVRELSDSDFTLEPEYGAVRAGDVPQSCAAIAKAEQQLSYRPPVSAPEGIRKTVKWYLDWAQSGQLAK